jgi:hypothetical protein
MVGEDSPLDDDEIKKKNHAFPHRKMIQATAFAY